MKVCVIQPRYSTDHSRSEELFAEMQELFSRCDESMDLIVLPESCDIPCLARTKAENDLSVEKFNGRILTLAAETARRCDAMVFVNARSFGEKGQRNTTYAFDRAGNIAGTYLKEHLVASEVSVMELEHDYLYEATEPTIVEMEGLRFAFLTCYDFYFYENFARIARKHPDFIIGCSHQRSDTHAASEIMSRFLAYNTNAYVLRASVSMDEDSDIGGGSMIVAPDGSVLAAMGSCVGLTAVEIDPAAKYYKPAGFGNPPAAHFEYIEKGRRPWKYRPAGAAIVPNDIEMPYPRVCAHRGFNTVAPENSMPAFGAAIAMGADEIEFDLWYTKDGEIVSIHDKNLDRVSDGEGIVYEKTYEELLQYDFGFKFGDEFRGMRILRFEEILQQFACQAVMNIHIKTETNDCEYPREYLDKIVALIRKYDCEKHVYFMCGNDNFHRLAREVCPDIRRCCGGGKAAWEIVDRAIELGCQKLQFFKDKFDDAMLAKAKAHGIVCNAFFADDEEKARHYVDIGIDTVLTNDYNRIAQAVRDEAGGKKYNA